MIENKSRIVLITGASGAIGKAIARQIAAKPGYSVVLHGRSAEKTEQAAAEIKRATNNPDVRYVLADISRRAAVESLAQNWRGPLHVLINNAAATPRQRLETPEGIEMQFATNVLSYLWMVDAFTEILKDSAPARVVNVASYWAGDLDLDDLEFKRRPYRNGTAYRQSKQANRMLTVALAERLKPFGITVNVCHPGDANSKLSNDLGFGGSESADSAAETPVWLATESIGGQVTGKYFEHLHEARDRFAGNLSAVEALFTTCQKY